MLIYFFILAVMFFASVFIYSSKYKHLLVMFLSLEFMVLVLYLLMMFYLTEYLSEYYMSMFFLTFSVCEGALSLSLLVLLVRSYGNDKILIFDNLW
uniref:NADH-ubiquinone oxidoreductase chain 4L n=1 Tax=Curculionoidea sp. 13 KM-2017 TaxID=2219396 RepID=A0A346RHF0_9CUCU|nr:NADH dehydrogenase subunit 4L [Curculionoidea sp. 13 KM-2017]